MTKRNKKEGKERNCFEDAGPKVGNSCALLRDVGRVL